nr:hypothetical protein CFP56_46672 [Quercus suber]
MDSRCIASHNIPCESRQVERCSIDHSSAHRHENGFEECGPLRRGRPLWRGRDSQRGGQTSWGLGISRQHTPRLPNRTARIDAAFHTAVNLRVWVQKWPDVTELACSRVVQCAVLSPEHTAASWSAVHILQALDTLLTLPPPTSLGAGQPEW